MHRQNRIDSPIAAAPLIACSRFQVSTASPQTSLALVSPVAAFLGELFREQLPLKVDSN